MADQVFGPLDQTMAFGQADQGIAFWDPEDATKQAKHFNTDGSVVGVAVLNGEGPTFMKNPWDVVTFNGSPMPGICKVTCEPELQIDQRKGFGHDGARIAIAGFLPGPVVISSLIWTHDQWNAFNDLRPLMLRDPGKDDPAVAAIATSLKISIQQAQNYVAAISVGHPWFQSNAVDKVIVRGISLDDGPQPQSKLIRLKCVQYMPPTQRAPSKTTGDVERTPGDAKIITAPHETGVGPRGSGHS